MSEVLVTHGYQVFSFETGAGSAWGTEASSPVLLHHPTMKYDVKQLRMPKRNRPMIGLAQSAHYGIRMMIRSASAAVKPLCSSASRNSASTSVIEPDTEKA